MDDPPSIGTEYDVEFTIDQTLALGKGIRRILSRDFAIRQENSQVILQGEIEAVDEGHLCTLRLGDSLVLFDMTGLVPSPGTFVRIATQDILLFDTHT
jgi:hypothetical protein